MQKCYQKIIIIMASQSTHWTVGQVVDVTLPHLVEEVITGL